MRTRTLVLGALGVVGGIVAARAISASRRPRNVAGARKSAGRLWLEVAASFLQRTRPLDRFHLHLVGFHPLRDDPRHQMEAHHYCRVINEDLIECILFDGDGPHALLTGIEYIVSERLFDSLPEREKAYWHPHNYEILSGQLIAPRIPAPLEKRLMRRMLNSYGKTWHLWKTADHDPVPAGDACLAWSFNRDGEVDPTLVASRDRRLGISSEQRSRQRADLESLAYPQAGEDLLRNAFAFPRPRPAPHRRAARTRASS